MAAALFVLLILYLFAGAGPELKLTPLLNLEIGIHQQRSNSPD